MPQSQKQIDLTILLFVDAEKPLAWDQRWFSAVRELNPTVWDRLQVLVLSQRQSSWTVRRLAENQPYDVQVIDCDQPRDSTGYPVWDVVAAARQAWPKIQGKYLSFNHIEYIHGPDRLANTCDWLMQNRPRIALGNLRRIFAHTYDWRKRIRDVKDPLNDTFARLIDEYYWAFIRDHWDLFGQSPWMYWLQEPVEGHTGWLEDVFFAETDWLGTMRFFEHGGRLPFQDVYDLMGPAILKLDRHGLKPECPRLSRLTHEACHIIHDRAWGSYTPTMREWFQQHADEFAGTAFSRADLWDLILTPEGCGDERPGQAIDRFRRAPGGTVTRWLVDFSTWLQRGGAEKIQQYYQQVEDELKAKAEAIA